AVNLFIMPSGTESPATETIISSERWQQFASEFAKADELLLLVVASTVPGLAKLIDQVDGVVLVGLQKLDAIPSANVLAKVPHPSIVAPPRIDIRPQSEPWTPLKVGIASGILLAAGVAGGAWYAGSRAPDKAAATVVAPIDSAKTDSVARPRPVALAPINPLDSSKALGFSVEILAANTAEGANFELKRHGSVMPNATISLVPIGDTEATWYKVYAGAYPEILQADQLLALLRRRKVVADSAGSVAHVPLAFLVDSVPGQGGVASVIRDKIQNFAGRGIAAYALTQRDGSARLYTGAFETPEQASLAVSALRVAGLTPVLAYRIGRYP
ncbi:MAG: hypothetical protein ABIQ55_09550, partial [Gemmatimonadaceae bacterium]